MQRTKNSSKRRSNASKNPSSRGAGRDNGKSAKRRSRIAAEILEGLTELEAALRDGVPLDQRFTVRTVERVLRPVGLDAEEIKLLRCKLGASQAVFAAVLGVSADSVQAWEQGRREPSDSALRMMHIFGDNPGLFLQQIQLKSQERSCGALHRR